MNEVNEECDSCTKRLDRFEDKLDRLYVTIHQFKPVQLVVYTIVGGALAAVGALVLEKLMQRYVLQTKRLIEHRKIVISLGTV